MAYMLAIHPTNTDTVYAAGYDYDTLSNYYPYFFESDDGGVTWAGTQLDTLEGEGYCISLASSDPQTIWLGATVYIASVLTPKVFISTDGGQTWVEKSSGLPSSEWLTSLGIHPTNTSIGYVGTKYGIYRTTNGGDSWDQVAVTETIWSFATSPADPSIVYAGDDVHVYKSVDTGATWALTSFHRGIWSYVKVRSDDASHVYVANTSGFFESTNGGADWFAAMDSMPGQHVRGLGVPPNDPYIIHSCAFGTYAAKSENYGNDWEWLGWIDERVGGSFRSYAFHNQNSDIVFGLTGYG
jgi:photosystem II stability/assembly factor-like uncharacterized protein